MRRHLAPTVAILLGTASVILSLTAAVMAIAANGSGAALLVDPRPVAGITFSLVGIAVATSRPHNSLGWIFLAIGLFQAVFIFAEEYATYALITNPGALPFGPAMSVFSTTSWRPGWVLILTFVPLLFPSGRLLSPGWRPVAWLSAAALLYYPYGIITLWPYGGRVLLEDPAQFEAAESPVSIVVFVLLLMCSVAAIASLLLRFRRSAGVERQQMKWFAYAAIYTAIADASFTILSDFLPANVEVTLGVFLAWSAAVAMPLAAGVAILRYRLWDIDVVIRRTLVYTVLTGLLALVYFGTVIVLQTVFGSLTGRQSPVVIVISTLVIAALFTPLRGRVQRVIDRRFFRQKYDAEQVLARFAQTARDEVELAALTAEMVRMVDEAMRPESVSLWLKPSERELSPVQSEKV
jgi:hypothetical protein